MRLHGPALRYNVCVAVNLRAEPIRFKVYILRRSFQSFFVFELKQTCVKFGVTTLRRKAFIAARSALCVWRRWIGWACARAGVTIQRPILLNARSMCFQLVPALQNLSLNVLQCSRSHTQITITP